MKKIEVFLPEIKLLGAKIRTNNQNELNYELAKIFPVVQRYFNSQLVQDIPNRVSGATFCVHTEYETDHSGDYTFFIGQAVSSFAHVPTKFEKHIIPEQYYAKFVTSGSMPMVLINVWHKIWLMPEKNLGGKRTYLSDFEIYEEDSLYNKNINLDIYVGIDKP